jgi:TetR/AcrR family transcriptional regulator, regulator of cefoperazone and chloramphenicol sensitivity
MRAMSRKPADPNARSEATRSALIAAAMEAFALSGYEAVSTRQIASAAGAHPGLIGYHFGSKEGLYLAVFEHIASTMELRIGPALASIDQALGGPGKQAEVATRSLALLGALCDAMVATLADQDTGPWGALMMREQQSPTAAFDLIYERFMRHVLDTMTRLVRAVDPARDEQAARLTVVALMGQMMVFRAARAGAMRHLGWKDIGPNELSLIQAMLRDNLSRLTSPTTEPGGVRRVAPDLRPRS